MLMLLLAFFTFLVSTLSLIIFLLINVLYQKSSAKVAYYSPFECGFSPTSNNRNNFSMQFFMIALIFLIFDIELVLLFPIVTNMSHSFSWFSATQFFTFLLLLISGLILEWAQSMLEWKLLWKS